VTLTSSEQEPMMLGTWKGKGKRQRSYSHRALLTQ